VSDGLRVAVRWQDLDALGHVSHVAYLRYFEEARDAWLRRHGIGREQYVVGRCTVEYRSEIPPEAEAVQVRCAAKAIGRSSLTLREDVVGDDGAVLAEAEFGLVLWDPRERRSRPIDDGERASLATNLEALG
jgi:acyl-CoA thioester hydrolase